MKESILFASLFFIMIGCTPTRHITEKYIKNELQTHKTGNVGYLETRSLYKSDPSKSKYIELTAYKEGEKKGLVIGADLYYAARQKYEGDNTVIAEINYIELSIEECQDILDNYQTLMNYVSKNKPEKNYTIYADHTVNEDLFISFQKSKGTIDAEDYVYLWIRDGKWKISASTFIKKLNKFIKY